jgi:uncharacterized protein YjbI with pentapeptide repeats
MLIEIKHRHTNNVLYACEAENMREAVLSAIKNKADLRSANLRWANLSSADLRWADLRSADLRWANLRSADLRSADLSSANLSWANLRWADLSSADLRLANLRSADLSSADLSSANLSWANLRWADLRSADLRWANLRWADLRSADLSWANLSSADLSSADLRLADLSSADLRSADLSSAKNLPLIAVAQNIIVSQGDIIGWKALREGKIAQLLIPSSAKRMNSIGSRKCRAEFVEVTAIFKGSRKVKNGFDKYTGLLEYKVGEIVKPDNFDDNIYTECSNGINFFITKLEAEEYDK